MALTDVTGVFSRYFVVGFFLPAYIAIVALWLTATPRLIPNSLESHSEGVQLAILGGVALVAGLALSGLNRPITWFFEGGSWPGPIQRAARVMQKHKFQRLVRARDDETNDPHERKRAAHHLDMYFPYSLERVMPTRLGNITRAYDQYSNRRWGLDGVTVWPRVEALLTDAERD